MSMVLQLVGTSAGLASYDNSRYGRDWPIVIDDVAIDGMPSNQADPNTWHYITDNGANTWWRNTPANITNGIVNALMRGSGNEPNNFAVVLQVNACTKTVHILLAADIGSCLKKILVVFGQQLFNQMIIQYLVLD